jgi:ubiquinone/menaquinone biosynthesis C-methylase UbiE
VSEEYAEKDRAIWQRIFATMPQAWFEAQPSDAMEQCRSFFEANPCERLLDLGCGFGRWALFLAGHGPVEIVGVDYAENGIRAASAWARRAGANAQFLVAAATSLPFRRATFDGVLAALLLDNLSRADLGRTLREINYSTRSGARGFFVFNPYLTEADLSSAPDDNPTKECMHVAYKDDELPAALPGWAVVRTIVSAERFRIVEGIYRPIDGENGHI